MEQFAYVICLNDSVQEVVIGSTKFVESRKNQLKEKYHKQNRHNSDDCLNWWYIREIPINFEKTDMKLDDIIEVRLEELKYELELHDWNKFENIITSYLEKKRNRYKLEQLELLENYRKEFMNSLQNLESGSYFFYDSDDWMPCKILHYGKIVELEATGYTRIFLPEDIQFDWKIGNKIVKNYET